MSVTIRSQSISAAQRELMRGVEVEREDFNRVSDASGSFGDIRPSITLRFPTPRAIAAVKNIGFLFGPEGSHYSNNMVITFALEGQIVQQQTNVNTYGLTDYAPEVTPQTSGAMFDELTVAFLSVNLPYVKMRLDSIFFGTFYTITDASLSACVLTAQTDPSAQTLPVSTLALEVRPLNEASSGVLPAGYTLRESITSDGLTGVDLGIAASSALGLVVETENGFAAPDGGDTNPTLFGYSSSGKYYSVNRNESDATRCYFNFGSSTNNAWTYSGTPKVFRVSGGKLYVDDVQKASASGSFTGGGNIFLGGDNNGGTFRRGSVATIKKVYTLDGAHELYPATNADGTAGLYDVKTNSFREAADTWTPGPAIRGGYSYKRGDALTLTVDGHSCGVWWLSEDGERVGPNAWSLTAYDAIGLLDTLRFPGKAYTQGTAADRILEDILGNVVYYESDFPANATALRGILQEQTRRQALQQFLIASGRAATTDGGALSIEYPKGFAYFIPTAKTTIYPSGTQPVRVIGGIRLVTEKVIALDYEMAPAFVRIYTNIEGNETSESFTHSQFVERGNVLGYIMIQPEGVALMKQEEEASYFFPDDAEVSYVAVERIAPQPQTATVIPAERTYLDPRIKSVAPPSSITVTAHQYGVEANGSITINGIRYADKNAQELTAQTGEGGGEKKEIFVSKATLISDENADAVIGRLSAYYSVPEKWSGKIVWSGEKLNDWLNVPTRWTTHTGGLIKKVLNVSKITACQAEVL